MAAIRSSTIACCAETYRRKRNGPAAANYIYNQKWINGAALGAGVFELGRTGHLKLREEIIEKPGFFGAKEKKEYTIAFPDSPPISNLQPVEASLLAFLKTLRTSGQTLRLEDLKKEQKAVQKFFKDWKKEIAAEVGEQIYDPVSKRAVIMLSIAGIILLALSILSAWFMGIAGAPFIIVAVLLGLCSFATLRLSPEIYTKRERLKAVRRALKNISKQTAGGIDWANAERYLIFAIALGSGKKTIESLVSRLTAIMGRQGNSLAWLEVQDAMSIAELPETVAMIAATTTSSFGGAAGVAAGSGAAGAAGGGGGGAG